MNIETIESQKNDSNDGDIQKSTDSKINPNSEFAIIEKDIKDSLKLKKGTCIPNPFCICILPFCFPCIILMMLGLLGGLGFFIYAAVKGYSYFLFNKN